MAATGVAAYVVQVLDQLKLLQAPVAEIVCPIMLVPLLILIKRDQLPGVRSLEMVGKRAYGLYLTNLIALTLALAGFQAMAPEMVRHLLLLTPVLIVIALAAPQILIAAIDRLPTRAIQRYVFG
jgi:peptidoglycan/LPS O-acetylase OafA/YrhL